MTRTGRSVFSAASTKGARYVLFIIGLLSGNFHDHDAALS